MGSNKCEFNNNCDIKTAYQNAKDYAASIKFVEDIAERAKNEL